MIAIGAGVTNAIGGAATNSSTVGINGINEALGTNQFFHNSVYIGGAPTAGTGSSYAFNGVQTVNTRSFRDNIFFNARSNSGATGKNYAVKINGTIANPSGLTINNNVYFANGSGAVFGFFNSLDVANLAAWQTAVGQDAASIEANPLFTSTTDLHLLVGSPAIDVAFNLGVANDFDGKTRPGANSLYDIGADERDGIVPAANDIQATAFINPTNGGNKAQNVAFSPQASFTNNGTANQTNITVRYRILTNPGNVEIYNQTFVIPSLGTAASTTVTFPNTTIATAGLYNIIAKAELPGDAVPANDEITGTLNILAPLAGVYTVGSGGNFPSLTNATGAFETLNNLGASANITFNIISDLTGETGAVALNEVVSGNKVLIKPSGAARTITGTGTTNLIKISGADGVTIDGSLSGGTDKSLTLNNTANGTVIWMGTNATSGANNDTVRNCIILGTATGQGIIVGSGITLGSPAEFPNSNNVIQNNTISRAQNAVYISGNAATLDQNWLITKNTFGSSIAGDKLTFRGMLIGNAQNFVISQNTISGVLSTTSSSSTMSGIQIANVINGGLIKGNIIKDIKQVNTAGWGSNGISLGSSSTASNITISNNFISDVASYGFADVTINDNGYGIYISTGGGYKLYNNSVSLSTNQTLAGSITACLNIASGYTTAASLDIRNNIFSNTQTVGTVYGVYVASTAGNAIFSSGGIDYNNYFATNIGFLTTARVTLANWKTATGQDVNSINVAPNFVNPANDLHLNPSVSCVTTGKGVNIAAVTDDIDLNTRNTIPFIGGHEAYEPSTVATLLFNTTPGTTDRTYLINGTTDYLKNCELINTITPSGGSPIAGLVYSKVTIDATVQTYNTEPYVQRHYDIEPVSNATTATATVKLYFTDAEFDNFNNNNPGWLDLPTVAGGGNADPNLPNLKVTQYHGTGTAPGNYTGAAVLLTPTSVVYNATDARWEVTVTVTGFSGFYVHTGSRPLPIVINYLQGNKQGNVHNLNWKVTCTSSPTATMILERSGDNRTFTAINNITADAVRCAQPFDYVDASPLVGINYYRLKIIDANGKVTYSNTIAMANTKTGVTIVGVVPNPVTSAGNAILNVASAQKGMLRLVVTDITGRQVAVESAAIIAGSNQIPMNVAKLAAGSYNITAITDDGNKTTVRFVKQ